MTTFYTYTFRTLSQFAATLPADHEFNVAGHMKEFEEKYNIMNKYVLEKINLALQVYEDEDWKSKGHVYESLTEYQGLFQEVTEEPTPLDDTDDTDDSVSNDSVTV